MRSKSIRENLKGKVVYIEENNRNAGQQMDNIIESFEYFDYSPSTTEDFRNASAEFNISVLNEDVTQPCKSLLVIRGTISLTDGDSSLREIDTDKVHFVNNGILHLFDRIDYYVGDAKIDTIRKPGVSTLMKGLVSFEHDLRYNTAGWKINTPSHTNPNERFRYRYIFALSIFIDLLFFFFQSSNNF